MKVHPVESLLEGELRDEHYHDAREHGLGWHVLNNMLHLIVWVHALFGMIRFKVKFIRMDRTVEIVRHFIIVHSWYLAIKFALIAAFIYLVNLGLDVNEITPTAMNCSLLEGGRQLQLLHDDGTMRVRGPNLVLIHVQAPLYNNYPTIASITEHIGGPFKLIGTRATLMYGFYGIGIYIMLAIFPIELIYLDIGFNFIRFVLNDVSCMKDLYDTKQTYLRSLDGWRRTDSGSWKTLSLKKKANQRKLRCGYTNQCQRFAENQFGCRNGPARRRYISQNWGKFREKYLRVNLFFTPTPTPGDPDPLAIPPDRIHQFGHDIESLRSRLAHNHHDSPTFNVKIARVNLREFKPHARSEAWFKSSMVVYPIFVLYYFLNLIVLLGTVSLYFKRILKELSENCTDHLRDSSFSLIDNWSFYDELTYCETLYCVCSLSVASSFYCSYYFGTIMELFLWIEEVCQQLTVGKLALQLDIDDDMLRIFGRHPGKADLKQLIKLYEFDPDEFYSLFNQFGGIEDLWTHMKLKTKRPLLRARLHELMAMHLLSRQQTLFRATYINWNLLFNELEDTRLMTEKTLARTLEMGLVLAFLVAITKSQFGANMFHIIWMLMTALIIMNLYLICAAIISNGIVKLNRKVHYFIAAGIAAGLDSEVLEFWTRVIDNKFIDSKDPSRGHSVFGIKVNWTTIAKFNGYITSVLFLTIS